ncbi:hypothetical protein KR044_008513 [Drosophila immigrans]|nr:hypothetical protein KR044_008513 [Drosophila immigrans]
MRLIGKKHVGVFLYATLVNMVTWGTVIKLNELKCRSVDPSFALFDKCEMRDIGRNDKEANMVVKLLQIPVTNVTIGLEIFRRGYTSQSLFHTVVDGCKFWINKRRNPIAIAVYKFFRMATTTNINHSCPYNVSFVNLECQLMSFSNCGNSQHDLIVDHLQFDKDLNLPLPIGKGEYGLKLIWKVFNVLRTTVVVNMQITD